MEAKQCNKSLGIKTIYFINSNDIVLGKESFRLKRKYGSNKRTIQKFIVK